MLDKFSAEFEKMYLDCLYRRHRTKRMNANNVYQEMIQDKHHIHMNSTKWTTLSDFVQYLGKSAKCVVEETERGWYVTYIERDPTILAQQENYERRVESEKREEDKLAKRMELQRIEAAKLMDRAGFGVNVTASKIQRIEDDRPIEIQITSKQEKKIPKKKGIVFSDESVDDLEDEIIVDRSKHSTGEEIQTSSSNVKHQTTELNKKLKPQVDTQFKRKSEMDVMKESERLPTLKKQKQEKDDSKDDPKETRKNNWICKDILVRVVSKKIHNGKYYKRKGIILHVYNKFTAEIEILDSGPDANDGGQVIECAQEDLETVVPKVGKTVLILNGKYRGMEATLVKSNEDKFYATLELKEDGAILKKVDFDDFSKAARK